jgi:hypothetical protein
LFFPPLCAGPWTLSAGSVALRFPFTAHSGKRERQRKSSGWSVLSWEASQSRAGPGRSQVCPRFNSPRTQLSRERESCVCILCTVFLSVYNLPPSTTTAREAGASLHKQRQTNVQHFIYLNYPPVCVSLSRCVYTCECLCVFVHCWSSKAKQRPKTNTAEGKSVCGCISPVCVVSPQTWQLTLLDNIKRHHPSVVVTVVVWLSASGQWLVYWMTRPH